MDSQAFVLSESLVYSDDGSNRWTDNPQLFSTAHSEFQNDYQHFDSLDLFMNDQYKNSGVDHATMAQIMQQQPFRSRPQDMHTTTFAYNTTARTRPAEPTEQPHAKRARFEDVPLERCYSQSGSQSECCSSCSEGVLCNKPECEDEAKSCTECACDVPVCPCPDETAQNPRVQVDCPVVPVETRLQDWNNSVQSAWTPPTLQASFQNGNGITRSHDNYQSFGGLAYNTAQISSGAMTSSMANNTSTHFSQNSSHQTQHMQQNTYNSSLADLSGAGALFQPSWYNSSMSTANNDLLTLNCGWDGCDVTVESNQQMLAHCFQSHVHPQMGFTCPIQPNGCPPDIGPDPIDHLRADHGFDFDFLNQGWACPAPDCAPDKVLEDPVTFKHHLLKAHTKPAQGILWCEMQHCDTSFKDFDQFSQHLTHQHLEDIDLGPQPSRSPSSSASPELPTNAAADTILSSSRGDSSRELSSQGTSQETKQETNQEANHDAGQKANQKASSQEPRVEDDSHTCKWLVANTGACGHVFDSSSKLQDHIIQDHLARLDKATGYKCCWEGCRREAKRGNENSGFSQRGKLERHMATHTNFKCCTCTVCSKTFSAEQALVQHMNLHSNIKPWACKHCGKRFPQQSACTIHERTHTKEKPLKCEICGKAFSESSNLSKHRKTHGEKGAHACTFPGCLKSFHRLDQLKRHATMHTRAGGVGVGSAVSENDNKTESEGE